MQEQKIRITFSPEYVQHFSGIGILLSNLGLEVISVKFETNSPQLNEFDCHIPINHNSKLSLEEFKFIMEGEETASEPTFIHLDPIIDIIFRYANQLYINDKKLAINPYFVRETLLSSIHIFPKTNYISCKTDNSTHPVKIYFRDDDFNLSAHFYNFSMVEPLEYRRNKNGNNYMQFHNKDIIILYLESLLKHMKTDPDQSFLDFSETDDDD
jgi:hypothetical protein